MKWRGLIGILLVCAWPLLAIAQSGKAGSGEPGVPQLGDIMNAVQWRQMKLWFAGKMRNWDLAAYELRLIKAGLVDAAMLYSGIPVSNVTTMAASVQSLTDAIEAKDSGKFAKAFGELTDGCNACHQSMGRGFIVMRVPTEQPFGNQRFTPAGKP
jgi:hypothetical protein